MTKKYAILVISLIIIIFITCFIFTFKNCKKDNDPSQSSSSSYVSVDDGENANSAFGDGSNMPNLPMPE